MRGHIWSLECTGKVAWELMTAWHKLAAVSWWLDCTMACITFSSWPTSWLTVVLPLVPVTPTTARSLLGSS